MLLFWLHNWYLPNHCTSGDNVNTQIDFHFPLQSNYFWQPLFDVIRWQSPYSFRILHNQLSGWFPASKPNAWVLTWHISLFWQVVLSHIWMLAHDINFWLNLRLYTDWFVWEVFPFPFKQNNVTSLFGYFPFFLFEKTKGRGHSQSRGLSFSTLCYLHSSPTVISATIIANI